MCGIAGAVDWGDATVVARMADVQRHRGPDDGGVFEKRLPGGAWVGLGSRRLAIRDLSPAGHMPFVNDAGDVVITYNGEIYNDAALRAWLEARGHRFRSRTDTEVVLRLYEELGLEALDRLEGMFAFAICDLRRGEPDLLLARDPFGIKPLYYVERAGRLGFASEVKALLELPELRAELDPSALHQYLTFLWVPDPDTLFSGVKKLPAGCFARFRAGRLTIGRYWDLSFPAAGEEPAVVDPDALAAEVRDRLGRAVRAQMVSDVPLGAFLSAGLDSSSIVALMAQASREPVRTFTITFPPSARFGEISLDDPKVAARTAARFGCRHREIVVEPDVVDLLPRLVWHMDEPIADAAPIMAYLICREARQDVTVLLSGAGGDELFAGYRKHVAHYWAEIYRRLPRALRRRLIEPALAALPAARGTPLKGLVRLAKKWARSGSLAPEEAFLMNATYFTEAQKESLYTPALAARLAGEDPFRHHRAHFARVAGADFLHRMLYVDTKAFLVSLNLTYTDKMSMASSVEVRVPFLHRELAEFVARAVPPLYKLRGRLRPETKHILRRAMADLLPAEVLAQRKAGFGGPIDAWLAGDLREMVDDLLSERRVRARGLFRPEAVRRLVEEQRRGRHDWSYQVWQLLTLELWQQTFTDGAPARRAGERAFEVGRARA